MKFDDTKWSYLLIKIFQNLVILEKNKYLEPYYSK